MEQLVGALIASAITIVGAVATFVVSWLKNKAVRQQVADIEKMLEASGDKFFIHCPTCGTKIYLSNVDIKKEVE